MLSCGGGQGEDPNKGSSDNFFEKLISLFSKKTQNTEWQEKTKKELRDTTINAENLLDCLSYMNGFAERYAGYHKKKLSEKTSAEMEAHKIFLEKIDKYLRDRLSTLRADEDQSKSGNSAEIVEIYGYNAYVNMSVKTIKGHAIRLFPEFKSVRRDTLKLTFEFVFDPLLCYLYKRKELEGREKFKFPNNRVKNNESYKNFRFIIKEEKCIKLEHKSIMDGSIQDETQAENVFMLPESKYTRSSGHAEITTSISKFKPKRQYEQTNSKEDVVTAYKRLIEEKSNKFLLEYFRFCAENSFNLQDLMTIVVGEGYLQIENLKFPTPFKHKISDDNIKYFVFLLRGFVKCKELSCSNYLSIIGFIQLKLMNYKVSDQKFSNAYKALLGKAIQKMCGPEFLGNKNLLNSIVDAGKDKKDLFYNQKKKIYRYKTFISLLKYIAEFNSKAERQADKDVRPNCLDIDELQKIIEFINNKEIKMDGGQQSTDIKKYCQDIASQFVVKFIDTNSTELDRCLAKIKEYESGKIVTLGAQNNASQSSNMENNIVNEIISKFDASKVLGELLANATDFRAILQAVTSFYQKNALFAHDTIKGHHIFTNMVNFAKNSAIALLVTKVLQKPTRIDTSSKIDLVSYLLENREVVAFEQVTLLFACCDCEKVDIKQLMHLVNGILQQYDGSEQCRESMVTICVNVGKRLLANGVFSAQNCNLLAQLVSDVAQKDKDLFECFMQKLLSLSCLSDKANKAIEYNEDCQKFVNKNDNVAAKIDELLEQPANLTCIDLLIKILGKEEQIQKHEYNKWLFNFNNKMRIVANWSTTLAKEFTKKNIATMDIASSAYKDALKKTLQNGLKNIVNLQQLSDDLFEKLNHLCSSVGIDENILGDAMLQKLRDCTSEDQLNVEGSHEQIVACYNAIMKFKISKEQQNEAETRVKLLLPYLYCKFKRVGAGMREVCVKNIEAVTGRLSLSLNNLLQHVKGQDAFYKAYMMHNLDLLRKSSKNSGNGHKKRSKMSSSGIQKRLDSINESLKNLCSNDEYQVGATDFIYAEKRGTSPVEAKESVSFTYDDADCVIARRNGSKKTEKMKSIADLLKAKIPLSNLYYSFYLDDAYAKITPDDFKVWCQFTGSVDGKDASAMIEILGKLGDISDDNFKLLYGEHIEKIRAQVELYIAEIAESCVLNFASSTSNKVNFFPSSPLTVSMVIPYSVCKKIRNLLSSEQIKTFDAALIRVLQTLEKVEGVAEFKCDFGKDKDNFKINDELGFFSLLHMLARGDDAILTDDEKYAFVYKLIEFIPSNTFLDELRRVYDSLASQVANLKDVSSETDVETFAKKLPLYMFCRLLMTMIDFAYHHLPDDNKEQQEKSKYKKLFAECEKNIYSLAKACLQTVKNAQNVDMQKVRNWLEVSIGDNVFKVEHDYINRSAHKKWMENCNENLFVVYQQIMFNYEPRSLSYHKFTDGGKKEFHQLQVEEKNKYGSEMFKSVNKNKYGWTDSVEILYYATLYLFYQRQEDQTLPRPSSLHLPPCQLKSEKFQKNFAKLEDDFKELDKNIANTLIN